MKLFNWVQRKVLPSLSLEKKHFNSDRQIVEGTASTLAASDRLKSVIKETHAEVLTIGTLGMGNLLNSDDHDEEEKEEEEVEVGNELAHTVSPIEASSSPNRESVSSNRESVSSVDIQKLQEELQKILYFRLGQGQIPAKDQHHRDHQQGKGRRLKNQKKNKNNIYMMNDDNKNNNGKQQNRSLNGAGAGRSGVFPLHNFLEMPMDQSPVAAASNSAWLQKKQYYMLMQSLKAKLLHYAGHQHIKMPPSLFDNLTKPKVKLHGSKVDKLLELLRRVMSGRQDGKRYREEENCMKNEEDKVRGRSKEEAQEVEEEEEERLRWAVSKSCRGSERFINYMTSRLAQVESMNNNFSATSQFHSEAERLQLMLSSSPTLANECWIRTDDEYLVLEL